MSFLSRLPHAAVDPIFAVAAEARAAGEKAIDASVGMILDEDGKPAVLPCVRLAAEEWARALEQAFPYPPLLGIPAFRRAVTTLVFGSEGGVASAAAAGGTGALALNLKLLKLLGITRVLLPSPSWPNHRRLIEGQGLQGIDVPFLDADGEPSPQPLLKALEKAGRESCGLLLQASCHNPTGKAWTADDWRAVAAATSGSSHVVLLDCAYQGLGEGVEEDVQSVRLLRDAGVSLLLAWSASKNHTIYGLRTGLACAVTASEEEREEIEKHYGICLRQLHSAAPTVGQQLVAAVQGRHGGEWRNDVGTTRELIRRKRERLIEAFPDWRTALRGQGLFAMLPLSPASVLRLRAKGIFFTEDGRINIAGIPLRRLDAFTEAVRAVL
jgi:aspartate/tyrosine/aromatic aminotransferase